MTRSERERLRALIDQTRRERLRAEAGPSKAPPISHGTQSGYRRGCRCDECRGAKRKQRKAARAA